MKIITKQKKLTLSPVIGDIILNGNEEGLRYSVDVIPENFEDWYYLFREQLAYPRALWSNSKGHWVIVQD